jgi:hypothetical protein
MLPGTRAGAFARPVQLGNSVCTAGSIGAVSRQFPGRSRHVRLEQDDDPLKSARDNDRNPPHKHELITPLGAALATTSGPMSLRKRLRRMRVDMPSGFGIPEPAGGSAAFSGSSIPLSSPKDTPRLQRRYISPPSTGPPEAPMPADHRFGPPCVTDPLDAARRQSPCGALRQNLSLYWLTSTATSAARLYWENHGQSPTSAAAQKTSEIKLPVAITRFGEDAYRPPETWTRRADRTLTYFHEVDKGGHFAAWEQPELFAGELRAAFRSFR